VCGRLVNLEQEDFFKLVKRRKIGSQRTLHLDEMKYDCASIIEKMFSRDSPSSLIKEIGK
jgi:hypothetical protein